MIIEIKTGKWPLEKVQIYSADLFERMKIAAQSTALPLAVDMEAVNDLVVQCMKAHLRGLTK